MKRAAAAVAEAQATLAVEEARSPEIQDQVTRLEAAEPSGAVSTREVVVARSRLQTHAAVIEAAKTSVGRAQAEEQAARVGVEQAELTLSRMSVRAPMSGVVLQRLVEP